MVLLFDLDPATNNKMVRERIQIDRVVSAIVSQPLHRYAGAPKDEE